MTLEPLDAAATEALVAAMFHGSPVSRTFAAFLREHTDGVPLSAEASLRLLLERAELTTRDGSWMCRRLAELRVRPTARAAVLHGANRGVRVVDARMTERGVYGVCAGSFSSSTTVSSRWI